MKNVYTKDEVLDLIAWVVTGLYLPDAPTSERVVMAKQVREKITESMNS